jgi:nucleotide-binding universal stress UspA family protein
MNDSARAGHVDFDTLAGERPVRVVPEREPRLPASALLVLEEHGQPSHVLQRSFALARELGLDLHVLRVLRRRPLRRLLSHLHGRARSSLAHRAEEAGRALRAWCDQTLAGSRVPVHVRVGDVLGQAALLVHDRGAKLVIVPPREARSGARVINLAGSCSEPVLVLRTEAGFEQLVAATDLEDDEYPVLRGAVDLGRKLEARILAVHNVSPVTAVLPMEAAFATTLLLGADTVKLRAERLARASAQLGCGVHAVVTHQPDTVGVILRHGDATEPTLVVVGTRTKPWLNRFIVKSVSAEVVSRSPSSVLVLPVRERPWFDNIDYRRRTSQLAATPSSRGSVALG